MDSVLESLQRSFRIADAADILLVSLFLYMFFLWIKSSASRQILVGMGVLAVVYALARTFDLYMTAAIFQAVLAFGAIAAIVVFQEDLRRSFARLAALGNLPRAHAPTVDTSLDTLVEIAFELAKKRTGALLVIQGAEALDRHVTGGVAIDARISKALLDSIFDPHSMGHDGAVIVDRDRISHFAAHLPLSENSSELGTRGTRHCAALGLSELSDAMIIVVSEERGEVSVAGGGRLTKLDSPMELKQRLEQFVRPAGPSETNGGPERFLVENSLQKLAAVFVACFAWFLVSFEAESVQKTFVVPIEYRNLPDAMDIDDSAPTEARITLTGYERAFNLLVPSTLKVSLDLSGVTEGAQQFAIDESHIKRPSNLTLFRSIPRVVELSVHTWVRGRVAVAPRTEGRLPLHLRQRELRITPESVPVMIWRSSQSSTTKIYTEPIELGRLTDAAEFKARLIVPQNMRLDADQPAEVSLRLEAAGDPGNVP